MSIFDMRTGMALYVECKSRWIEKYRHELFFEFEKFTYCRPNFYVDLWLKHSAYLRTRLFRNKKSGLYFKFVSAEVDKKLTN